MLLAHVRFTRSYIFEYKFNNMDGVNIVFENTLFRHREFVGAGSLTENEPLDISELNFSYGF